MLGSLINVLYIHPIIRAAFRKRQGKRVALRMPVAMGITIVLCIVLIFAFSSYVYEIVRRVDPTLAPSLELVGMAG